jgi:hypothetical protein
LEYWNIGLMEGWRKGYKAGINTIPELQLSRIPKSLP